MQLYCSSTYECMSLGHVMSSRSFVSSYSDPCTLQVVWPEHLSLKRRVTSMEQPIEKLVVMQVPMRMRPYSADCTMTTLLLGHDTLRVWRWHTSTTAAGKQQIVFT